MTDERAHFKEIEDADYWRRLNPELSVTDRAPLGGVTGTGRLEPDDRDHVIREGYLRRDSILAPAEAAALAAAIGRLQAAGKHPVFAYVYDEVWQLLERLAPLHAALLGEGYEIVPDFWAWKIDPDSGGGWSPHRGWCESAVGEDGMPTMINVWVALTDVTPLDACMHIVPLSADPSFPSDLESIAVPTGQARALPVPAGSALLWNANALHWGGSSAGAISPRVSLSFTARRGPIGPPLPPMRLEQPLPFKTRLDLIADQLLAYADKEPASTALALRWATLIAGMRAAR